MYRIRQSQSRGICVLRGCRPAVRNGCLSDGVGDHLIYHLSCISIGCVGYGRTERTHCQNKLVSSSLNASTPQPGLQLLTVQLAKFPISFRPKAVASNGGSISMGTEICKLRLAYSSIRASHSPRLSTPGPEVGLVPGEFRSLERRSSRLPVPRRRNEGIDMGMA